MRKHVLISISLLISVTLSVAQDLPPRLMSSRPVYFDVSPPMRDLVKQEPAVVDRSWKDGVVPNKFGSEVDPALFQSLASGKDAVLQDHGGLITGDTIVSNFEGIWNCNGYVPPDTYGEAGPNCYFQVINASYAIYNKTGGRIFGPVLNSSVWAGMPYNDNSGDATVSYDENADRWVFSQFSLPNYPAGPFFQMIAVSVTADPMGPWYRYQYEFPYMNDYPKFGVWPDGYYMSCNYFASGAGWVGNGAYAFDRTAMLAGNPGAMMVGFQVPPGSAGFITLYPSDCDGPFPSAGTPNYFGYIKLGAPQKFGLYEFHADFTNPGASTFGNLISLDVAPFDMAYGIPQKGTNVQLETLGDRFMYRLQYRKFADHASMVINHTVATGPSKAGIRWYELRKTTGSWAMYQQSTYSPADADSRWMGSIAMDTAGSIALGFSVSGPDKYPSISYTGRKKTDPLNQMTIAEKTIIEGGGCQTGIWGGRSRWGDYSGMSIDPDAPTTFWFTTEYYATTSQSNWVTRIAAFTFDNQFSSAASALPATICTGDSSQLDALAYGGSGSYTYSWSSIPAGFTSTLKNPMVWPADSTAYVVTITDGTDTHHDTAWVHVVPNPSGSAGNDTIICSWATEVPLNGTASSYKHTVWGTLGDGHFSDHYTLNTIYYPGPGDYASGGADIKLVVFAQSPCEGKLFLDKHITIDACTGTGEDARPVAGLTLMPNPAHESVTVTVTMPEQTAGRLIISSMDGRTCHSEVIRQGTEEARYEVDLSRYSKGVYVVRLETGRQVVTKQLVVQ